MVHISRFGRRAWTLPRWFTTWLVEPVALSSTECTVRVTPFPQRILQRTTQPITTIWCSVTLSDNVNAVSSGYHLGFPIC
ncbi:hypothetical protein BD779DRAFT_286388 [Infundibulicybe gibba]|nr:hypothetical protein BD779DRAFT_286388 [Infundibulicybe gibba]